MSWFLHILGWAWIALGLWGALRPQSARKRFARKFRWKLRFLLLASFSTVGAFLISAGWRLEGIVGVIVAVVGSISVLKGLLFLRGKAADVVLAWWEARPDWVYRAVGGATFVGGLLLHWVASRS